MSRVFVFPGQGSQAVGMGRGLAAAYPAAREVFEEVNDALGEDLTKLMFEGPEDQLTLTANAQPALMAVSMAAFRVLERQSNLDLTRGCTFLAGHSLGEYSALVASGSMSVGDAARILRVRGRAMQEAVPVGVGGMAALPMNLEEACLVAEEAAQGLVCAAGNDNAPRQVVLSGAIEAIRRALGIAARYGAKRSVLLPVSAPFHCKLMSPAANAVEEALSRIAIKDPIVPVISNVTAGAVHRADDIRRLLIEQITSMVRWRETMLHAVEIGVTQIVEVGTGKVLTGLARRIDKNLAAISVGTPEEVEAYLAAA